jgi:hypothetical protein
MDPVPPFLRIVARWPHCRKNSPAHRVSPKRLSAIPTPKSKKNETRKRFGRFCLIATDAAQAYNEKGSSASTEAEGMGQG